MRTVSISLVRLLIASVILLVPHASTAQVLGIQGDHFTVSGNPQFLVFISYSDGLRRIPDVSNCNDSLNTNTLKTDLQYLATKRVAGIRVFPNWQDPSSTLMDVTGALRCLQLKKLKALDGKPGVTVVGVADFDGDGHLDLVWQKDSTRDWIIGSLFDMWFQGVSGWKIVGVADFNGDGHPDLVWQRDDSSLREVTVWYMAGAHGDQLQSWTYLANPGVSGWRALVR